GYDVVSGWKKVRHDPWHKVLPSRVFNAMVSGLTGVKLHDHNCGMKCYRLAVVREVRLYGEMHRFVPVLAAARGFRASEVVIQHRARKFGHSKYGLERLAKGFLDLLTVKFLTGFGSRPQHLLGGIGLLSFFLGLFGMTYLAAYWIISRLSDSIEAISLHQTAAIYYCLGLLLMGGQFMSIGFLSELIISQQPSTADSFAVSDTVGPIAPESGLKKAV
ncbi:MAG: glycosyltransferase, partial [Planctomycetales bacterium]|nr:glycosyltransferase [Planctomycetales bacterium]